jgi:hypothetical protein
MRVELNLALIIKSFSPAYSGSPSRWAVSAAAVWRRRDVDDRDRRLEAWVADGDRSGGESKKAEIAAATTSWRPAPWQLFLISVGRQLKLEKRAPVWCRRPNTSAVVLDD